MRKLISYAEMDTLPKIRRARVQNYPDFRVEFDIYGEKLPVKHASVKESSDGEGIIIDVFDKDDNLLDTNTIWYHDVLSDVEERFREIVTLLEEVELTEENVENIKGYLSKLG